MNCDKTSILAYIIGKKIVIVAPYADLHSTSKVSIQIYILVLEEISKSLDYRLNLEMYYISDQRYMTREYINLKEMIINNEVLVVEFYGSYYQVIILKSLKLREPT